MTHKPQPPIENTINLVGEQAEAFDQHMDADRDWFESSSDAFYFRPEIEGEFAEYLIAGATPPFVHALVATPQGTQELPLGWTCVVDIGRYLDKREAPTGFRCRIRTSPPINGDVRETLLEGVRQYVDHFIPALKKQASKTKPKGFG
jgi:hypothetical protein